MRSPLVLWFLQEVYGAWAPGWLTVFSLPYAEVGWFLGTKLDAAARYPQTRVTHFDMYFAVGLRGQALGRRQRGRAQDVVAIPGLWVDLDIESPVHRRTDLLPTREAARPLLKSFPFLPTALLDSGHGLQGYWLFERLWVFETAAERQAAAALLYRF